MTGITLTARDLHDRRSAIIRLLTPLVADRGRIEIRRIGAGQKYTLGVMNKGQSPQLIENADLIRVPTIVGGVFLNYYEVWASDRASADYVLDRAYMHIHLKRANEAPDKQILCLHCDPLTNTAHQSFYYKRGPHLHVLGASPNIDRSHISVCLSDPQHGGADIDALTHTLQLAVTMIQKEIFPNYRST